MLELFHFADCVSDLCLFCLSFLSMFCCQDFVDSGHHPEAPSPIFEALFIPLWARVAAFGHRATRRLASICSGQQFRWPCPPPPRAPAAHPAPCLPRVRAPAAQCPLPPGRAAPAPAPVPDAPSQGRATMCHGVSPCLYFVCIPALSNLDYLREPKPSATKPPLTSCFLQICDHKGFSRTPIGGGVFCLLRPKTSSYWLRKVGSWSLPCLLVPPCAPLPPSNKTLVQGFDELKDFRG